MGEEIEKRMQGDGEIDGEKWVLDSSVDYKGRVPPRASTGVWKASLFVITLALSERLSYFGIAPNLILYLTKVLRQDLKTAAKNVNYWSGVTTLMPLIGGILADAYTGRFLMLLISSLIYLVGLTLLALSQFVPSLKPCGTGICNKPRKIHEVVYFLALYCVSLGTGGQKPCFESLGADQFDSGHLQERKKKLSFFNWWNFAMACGLLLGVTVVVYVQDNVSFGVAYLILATFLATAILTFFIGRPYYRYRIPEGSPFTSMLQVLVAALRKRKLRYPSSPALLYEAPNPSGRFLGHTNSLRFLDKAAILEEKNLLPEQKQSSWRLATVTKVEELKLVLNMIPIWLTSLMFAVCEAQPSTFFVKQGATMNRKVTANFTVPAASIYALAAIGTIISVAIYERILVPFLRKVTGNQRGINIFKRVGIGFVFSIIAIFVAALVERERLRVAKKETIQLAESGHLSMSVFWLVPQYMLIGIADGFTLAGLQEFFYDQVPDSMRSLGLALFVSIFGASKFLSNLLITVADHVSTKAGKSWFGKDLNTSRLDNFYWLLVALSLLNLCAFAFFGRRYAYKNVQRQMTLV
ncbi:protein NRT1/ PTR FAMILY 5.6-like [Tripterygium wilfordii]|uniref:Protein NRT1/ PTR FAMILY 5.6-like n=1 Tax=Tripterygium wilfordii TaxID=458696 RepID=A0A7J7CIG0_TRIWF|nr:protein NRT1/ PTR FAMILY 5.6-like [Tripterygium wilfordii]KAF5733845.1 protein NRT1/ PTR FAMILY 5.6-like [Tripterygium wilfordii]